MAKNPFYFKALPVDAPYCDREGELAALMRLAESGNDAVIFSPRRFGKTSLVRRVQKNLAERGAITIFVDFYGVGSVNEVASRLATSTFQITHGNESLWKKATRLFLSFRPVLRPTLDGQIEISAETAARRTGIELLESVMSELANFISDSGKLAQIVFDEFQEIVTLPDAMRIEAAMRTYIQQYRASHFFVGSRRRVLLGIFNEQQRPFFQSAQNFPLPPLPARELAEFVSLRFQEGGISCSPEQAMELARVVKCHPHYTQRLGYFVFENATGEVTTDGIYEAVEDLLSAERPVFEAFIQGLPPQQRLLLRALAKEPAAQVMAKAYARRHDLGTASGIHHSLRQLALLDFVEEDENSVWNVVDPVFAIWLARR